MARAGEFWWDSGSGYELQKRGGRSCRTDSVAMMLRARSREESYGSRRGGDGGLDWNSGHCCTK